MTPTSETGARRRREGGFTLVELMVVVFLIGLLAGAVVLAVPDGRPSLRLEAEQFGARLKRAQEEAVLTNRPVEVEISQQGYSFRIRDRNGWRSWSEGPFRQVDWIDDTVPADIEGHRRVGFDPTGLSTPAAFTLKRGERRIRVSVDASGNVGIDAAQAS